MCDLENACVGCGIRESEPRGNGTADLCDECFAAHDNREAEELKANRRRLLRACTAHGLPVVGYRPTCTSEPAFKIGVSDDGLVVEVLVDGFWVVGDPDGHDDTHGEFHTDVERIIALAMETA